MDKLWILCLCIGLVQYSAAQCDNDNGWYELNGDCFRVSRSAPETQYTWQEARAACLAEGGDLASIHSLQEQTFIVGLAAQVGLTGIELWIGMNQLESKAGPFSWSDGSEADYLYWSQGHPLTGGLTFCGYTKTEDSPGPFQRTDYTSVIYGLLSPGYDYPWEADGVDTFYFGSGYEYDQNWCESRCEAHPRCAAYSWYIYHWDYNWDTTCVGRSDRYNILEYDSYSDSGVRSLGAGPYGWWFSSNCGLNRAFACRKEMGSDTPIIVTTPAPLQSFCPDGYFSADGDQGITDKCYRIVGINFEEQGMRWEQALLLCRSGPGVNPDLASFTTAEEHAIVVSKLQEVNWGHWIGMHYINRENVWVWSDNSEPGITNWAPGQPDGASDQCVEMWTSHDPKGAWNDLSCSSQRGFVCQTYKDPVNIVPTPMSTTPSSCPEGWLPYWYSCYQVVTEPNTWQGASDYCSSIGGALTSIHSEAENSAVFYGVSNYLQFPAWIGLSKVPESGGYGWVDGWPVYYLNFDVNGTVGGDGCVAMKQNTNWQDSTCSTTLPFICKLTDYPTPTVPEGDGYCPSLSWVKYGDHCYQFNAETVEFNDALVNCRLAGGTGYTADLVSIESYQENLFVESQMKGMGLTTGAFIGLVRDTSGSGYRWSDGTPVGYLNWAPGEPSDPVFEVCTEMWVDNWPGKWNDIRCSSTDYVYRSYICEANLGPSPTYPDVPTAAPGECPSQLWQTYGTDCYLFRMQSADYRSWHEAAESCKILTGGRGNLASIASDDENNFIWFWADFYSDDLAYNNHIWVGLSKTGYGQPFQWQDGSELTYTNWAPGEPNDQDGSNNCVRMYVNDIDFPYTTRWDDYSCGRDYENGFVCKLPQGQYQDVEFPNELPPRKGVKVPAEHANMSDVDEPDSSHVKNLFNMHPVDLVQWNVVPEDQSNNNQQEGHPNDGLKSGETVSIVLGAGVALVGALVILAMVLVKNKKKQQKIQDTKVAVVELESNITKL